MLLIAIIFCLISTYTLSDATDFQSLTSCNCLTQNVNYECTVAGGSFTVWSGSAFMCQGGEISLRHVDFLSAIGECNSGAVIARGIKINNSRFTSQLTVRLSQGLIGRSVTCSVEDGPNLIEVGSGDLTVSTSADTFPPPSKIYIESIGPNEINFSWSVVPISIGCSSFFYTISATQCGICSPNVTASNSSSCTNFNITPLSTAIAADPCDFAVQSVICENITGDMEHHLVTLAVPDAPIVRSVPHYAYRRASLLRLAISFQVVEPFNISTEQGIDGSATSYTVTYAESPSGKVCNTATNIMASSCEDGICNHTFDVSTSTCSSTSIITTTVFASNLLGNGPNSLKIATDGKNAFVDVRFDAAMRSFSCDFLNQSILMGRKVCIANITYGENCDQHLGIYSDTSIGSSVTTPTIEFISGESFYCISVSASNSNRTVIVEGNLDLLNIGQRSTTSAGVVAPVVSVLVTVVVCMIVAIIVGVSLYLVYTHKSHKEERIITFTTSKSSSLTDVLQVFKNHGVSILSVNTHLHHTGINLETKPGFIDNYVFCNCSKRQREELKSEVENIEFFDDNQESDDTALVKCTVKVSVSTPGSILETLEVFNIAIRMYLVDVSIRCSNPPQGGLEHLIETSRKGIEILGVNTSTENQSVVCKCSEREKRKILEDLKKMGTDSADFSHAPLRTLKSKTSTRRIEFLVRPGASSIARALAVFGGCGVNITEINPDYVKNFDSGAPQPGIFEPHNLVECVCKEGVRKELFQKLAENGARNIHSLPDEALPTRNNVNQGYIVVTFSVTHEVGALARALKAFEDLDINILGINTLGCADHSTLQRHLNYKKCKLEFNLLTNEHQKELIKGIQATGIVVETVSLSPGLAAAERCCLQLLIEDPEDGKSISLPKALQAVFTVFQEFEIAILGYEMDDKSTCQRQYQHNHVEYSSKNAEEQHQVLIKALTATGIVKVLDDFLVDDDDDKDLIRNSIISCV